MAIQLNKLIAQKANAASVVHATAMAVTVVNVASAVIAQSQLHKMLLKAKSLNKISRLLPQNLREALQNL